MTTFRLLTLLHTISMGRTGVDSDRMCAPNKTNLNCAKRAPPGRPPCCILAAILGGCCSLALLLDG